MTESIAVIMDGLDGLCSDDKCSDGLSVQLSDRRLDLAIRRIIEISIPFHLKCIQNHKQLIEKHRLHQHLDLLLKEQINGLQSVQRLKSELRELETLGQSLTTSDQQLVCQQIITIKTNVCSVVQQFIESNHDLTNPLIGVEASDEFNYPEDQMTDKTLPNGDMDSNVQIMADINDRRYLFNGWQTLSKELIDLNDMFNTIVMTLKGQKERVNSIEANINDAHEDVVLGTRHLSKASALKSTSVAITAGLLSGAVFGPIGMLAGFKFSGLATALGAGIISYSGVKFIQNKSITSHENELISNNDNIVDTKKND